jgi:hypothetical protein
LANRAGDRVMISVWPQLSSRRVTNSAPRPRRSMLSRIGRSHSGILPTIHCRKNRCLSPARSLPGCNASTCSVPRSRRCSQRTPAEPDLASGRSSRLLLVRRIVGQRVARHRRARLWFVRRATIVRVGRRVIRSRSRMTSIRGWRRRWPSRVSTRWPRRVSTRRGRLRLGR